MSRLFLSSTLPAMVILGASFWFKPETLPQWELCSFRRWTDLPCAGCGMTRSLCAISHGDFGRAFEFHPFGFLFYGVTLVLLITPLLDRWIPGYRDWTSRSPSVLAGVLVVVGGLMVFGVGRILYSIGG